MKLSKLMHEIITSELTNEDIAKLADLLKRKRRQNVPLLQPGDRCVIGEIRPKYMIGAEVRVVKINQTSARCEITSGGRVGDVVNIPMTCLTKVEVSDDEAVADAAADAVNDQTI
ncbi:MAG: hypothetical protein GY759_09050 [Chloroflexi bacterium]|nr:hypothetical protein [Chloroflexota bacterium]